MKITVIGCGRWGTFLAGYLSGLGNSVLLYGRASSENLRQLVKTGKNEYMELDPSVSIETSLEKALAFSENVFISIDSRQLRSLAGEINVLGFRDRTYVLCMKGLENETGMRLTEVMEDVIGKDARTAVLVGPGHVQNFIAGIPSCMVIDSKDTGLTKSLAELIASPLIRLYYGEDIIGTEVGAAAKNVIGIAAGMLDGLGYSSLKGALMARGAREVSRLVLAMGGNMETVYGLSHLGDYEATLFSPYSRNRRLGEDFVLGRNFQRLAEGASTVRSLLVLSQKYNVDMPISRVVHSVLYEKADAKEGLVELFVRPLKFEFRN
ncbi:MAG: NAD(P)H-dependent glycerol-3-phosphate dehydrogenase [Clostridia bacterium]|nr:NAD(P)H-dependent glycerol-3-phosphate dehydrogenase [Clostridia bacterium]